MAVVMHNVASIPFTVLKILSIVTTIICQQTALKGPLDVCERDVFNGTCPSGEVMIMQSAMYGRMKVGKCLQKYIGNTNCDMEVLHIMDGICSGVQSCTVRPWSPLLLEAKPCPDYSAYLSLSYKCIEDAGQLSISCSSNMAITSSSGFLFSAPRSVYGPGTIACPWTLTSEGQRYNITLLKFVPLKNSPLSSSSSVCFEIGTIEEAGLAQGILTCGSDPRQKVLFLSKGGPIRIHFKDNNFLADLGNFALHFTELGCPDPTAPSNAILERKGGVAVVTCKFSNEQWQVQCNNGRWEGEIGQCPAEATKDSSVLGWIKTNTKFSLAASGIPRYCNSEQTIATTSGYLSSAFIQEEGTRRCPWVIGSHGNQRFNLTLYKFIPHQTSPLSSSSSVCFEIGTIQEGDLSQGILSCGSDHRVKVVHVSKGRPIRIHFKDKSFLEDLGTFVFHFNALECGEPSIPHYAIFKRTDNKGTISCTNQELAWDVECQNGEWTGEVGTCDTDEKASVFKWIKTNTSYSIGLLGIVTLICVLVIFLGGFCIYVTYFYAMRQTQNHQSGSSNYEVDIYKLQTMQRLKRPPSAVYERTTSLPTPPGTMRRNTDYQRMNPIDPDTVSHHSYVLYDHVPKPLPPIPIDEEKKHIYETPLRPDQQ